MLALIGIVDGMVDTIATLEKMEDDVVEVWCGRWYSGLRLHREHGYVTHKLAACLLLLLLLRCAGCSIYVEYVWLPEVAERVVRATMVVC